MFIGIANPIPELDPDLLAICAFIPITSPFELNNGPPEFPGLIEASCCITEPIKKFVSKSDLALPIALIIPDVKVKFSPKGFPIAIA